METKRFKKKITKIEAHPLTFFEVIETNSLTIFRGISNG